MKQFKLVCNYSPVDRGVNGGTRRSENMRLISIKRMHYHLIDGCDELNVGELDIVTFGTATLTHEGSAVITKQEEKTFQLPAELEGYGCIVSNALMKLDRNQDNIKLYDFAVCVCHKTDLKRIPMHPLTDQEWEELYTSSFPETSHGMLLSRTEN
jgi:hypothetical protein